MTPEEYKRIQQEKMSSFKVGSEDINGYQISRIFARGDEYLIYEIKSDNLVESVRVYINNITEKDDSGIIKRYNSIRIKFVEIKGLFYKVVDKTTIKTIVAQILAQGLTQTPEEANEQFDNLKKDINQDYRDQFTNRLRLLFSSLILSLLLILFAIVTYYAKLFNDFIHIKNLIYVVAAGSMGGFFSISSGLKKIICEKDVNKWIYIVYGFERIIIAILASTIIYFAIRGELVFGGNNKMENPIIGYVLFGFLAGFSETLVPNLMKKLEKE